MSRKPIPAGRSHLPAALLLVATVVAACTPAAVAPQTTVTAYATATVTVEVARPVAPIATIPTTTVVETPAAAETPAVNEATTPAQHAACPTDLTNIVAGSQQALALDSDGSVWTWAWMDGYDEGFDGSYYFDRLELVPVPGLTGVTALASGNGKSLAAVPDGSVRAWSSQPLDIELADAPAAEVRSAIADGLTPPTTVAGLSDLVGLAAGQQGEAGADARWIALRSDGTVWEWGEEWVDDGTGAYVSEETAPAQVAGLDHVKAVAANGLNTLALRDDGTVWQWTAAHSDLPMEGEETTASPETGPTQVPGLTDVTAIAAGGEHALALAGDGTVWAWGSNAEGQLGDGTDTSRSEPVQVADLTEVAAIAAGENHSLALKQDGTVWAWGDNAYGQLGDGTNNSSNTPIQVPDLSGIAAIAGTAWHSLALQDDGTIWAWSPNIHGSEGRQPGEDVLVRVHSPEGCD